MLLPQLLFSENGPLSATVTGAGGTQVGGTAGVEVVLPVEFPSVTGAGGTQVTGAATVTSTILISKTDVGSGGVSVAGSGPEEFTQVLFFALTPTGGISLDGEAPVTAITVNIYNLADENVPYGGIEFNGSAVVGENIPFTPTGGIFAGGLAVVTENIPFHPSGGVYAGGSASFTLGANILPSGGAQVSGAAGVSISYVITPAGGATLAGAAVVTERQALFTPSGGIKLGGVAIAYDIPAGTTPTAENPYNALIPAWSFNYETGAPSRYTNLPATSVCVFNGVGYITTEAGVYSLDSDTDAGRNIDAYVMLPKTDYGSSHNKHMEPVYIGFKGEGKLKLTAYVNKKSPFYYEVSNSNASTGAKGALTNIGKGLEGRFWSFKIENQAGADFEIESVEFNPTSRQRHRA